MKAVRRGGASDVREKTQTRFYFEIITVVKRKRREITKIQGSERPLVAGCIMIATLGNHHHYSSVCAWSVSD